MDFSISFLGYIGSLFREAISWQQIAVVTLIALGTFIIRTLLSKILYSTSVRLFPKLKGDITISYLPAFERPLKALITISGIYLIILYLPFSAKIDASALVFFRSALIIILTWGFYNLTGGSISILNSIGKKLDYDGDEILISFLSKIIRVIIILLAVAIIAQEWGFDVNGFVAGLGLGGLAIALAAKDAIANVFGGIVIITDKPFTVGDWIATPSVEGVVEDVNFRSSKIRTFANAVTTMPNSVLANEAIINWSRMGKRRIMFNLGVTYTTPAEKLHNCVDKIKSMLDCHPGIHKELIFVRFDSFGGSSLDIFIYCFTISTKWGEYLEVKEDVNFKIMGILESEGVSVAFPSRSIYFENELKRDSGILKKESSDA